MYNVLVQKRSDQNPIEKEVEQVQRTRVAHPSIQPQEVGKSPLVLASLSFGTAPK